MALLLLQEYPPKRGGLPAAEPNVSLALGLNLAQASCLLWLLPPDVAAVTIAALVFGWVRRG